MRRCKEIDKELLAEKQTVLYLKGKKCNCRLILFDGNEDKAMFFCSKMVFLELRAERLVNTTFSFKLGPISAAPHALLPHIKWYAEREGIELRWCVSATWYFMNLTRNRTVL